MRCRDEGVEGVIRPLSDSPIHLSLEGSLEVAGIALPFLGGGDLAKSPAPTPAAADASAPTWPCAPGSACSLSSALPAQPVPPPRPRRRQAAERPSPGPDAPLSALTLIDLDSARELPLPLSRLGELPPDDWQQLAQDVRDFGDLLAQLATGQEGFPATASSAAATAFDTLVDRCLRSFPEVSEGYICLADEGLRFDLQRALDVQDAPPARPLARLARLWARRGDPRGRPR